MEQGLLLIQPNLRLEIAIPALLYHTKSGHPFRGTSALASMITCHRTWTPDQTKQFDFQARNLISVPTLLHSLKYWWSLPHKSPCGYAGLQKIKQSIWILREIFHFWGRFFISETNSSYLYHPYCIAPNLDGHCTLDQGYWSPAAVVINRHLENSSHDMCPCYILHWELTT